MNSTTSEERQKELFEQMFHLQTEIENPDTDYFVRLDAQSKLEDCYKFNMTLEEKMAEDL